MNKGLRLLGGSATVMCAATVARAPAPGSTTGHSHDYKRHGTSTLFAAFNVATGKVQAAHKKRRRLSEAAERTGAWQS